MWILKGHVMGQLRPFYWHIVFTFISMNLYLTIIDNLLENFFFMIVIMLKLYPDVHMKYAYDIFPKEKALLTFADKWKQKGASKTSKLWAKKSVRDRLASMFRIRRGITVDSGAADSVYPRSWVRSALIMISQGMRMGLHYVAAGGARIPNQGEISLKFWTKEGVMACLMFQVADINKPLGSVSHMTDNDYCVVFNKHEGVDVSYVLHKPTDTIMRLRRERGIYILDAWTEEEMSAEKEAALALFSRPS